MFGAGQPALGNSGAGMQVCPMRSDLEPAGFGGDQGVFVSFGGGQRLGRIQLDQIIFEHAFNIWLKADNRLPIRHATANGQHHTDPDNTVRDRGSLCCASTLSGEPEFEGRR